MIRPLLISCAFAAASAHAAEPHWAYEPPIENSAPLVADEQWPRNPIDRFVLERLSQDGLAPRPQADPARLLRRVHLDLVGLPPTIEQVDAFLADPSDAHYRRIVDELLASQHFGEKWASGWLDLARHADSDGYQRDGFRDVWPYRDWVIKSFNADMPFDQFTVEQLAGDLLPEATLEQQIATGFHRAPTLNLEAGTDIEEDRVKQVVDRVNTTGTVWLGMSLECAQCHDHKYDPISIRDYYSLFAFFNNTPAEGARRPNGNDASMNYSGPDVKVPLTPEEESRRAAAQQRAERAREQFVEKVDELCDALPPERLAALQELQPRTIELAVREKRGFDEAMQLRELLFKDGEAGKALGSLEKRIKEERKKARSAPFQIGFGSRVMRELDQPRETHVMLRGNFLSPGEKVETKTPDALHPFPEDAPRNRLGLARWIASPENPLTARVAVNRIWAELFGRGLVTSMEDFGRQGAAPTHPQLLDWLAVTFRETDGWSRKKSIRRIVLSSTYRQSAVAPGSDRERDPDNALYARGPRNRLPAELIRDQALAISGLLSKKMYGPPARPLQPAKLWRVTGEVDNKYYASQGVDLYRRGIYTIWRRSAHYPSFANFDAPNRGACTVRRETSNTPLQALTLMNDPAYVEMATAFAKRIRVGTGQAATHDQLVRAFRLALGRAPSTREYDVLQRILFTSLDTDGSEDEAWFDVATTLLNLHETITK